MGVWHTHIFKPFKTAADIHQKHGGAEQQAFIRRGRSSFHRNNFIIWHGTHVFWAIWCISKLVVRQLWGGSKHLLPLLILPPFFFFFFFFFFLRFDNFSLSFSPHSLSFTQTLSISLSWEEWNKLLPPEQDYLLATFFGWKRKDRKKSLNYLNLVLLPCWLLCVVGGEGMQKQLDSQGKTMREGGEETS